VVSSGVERCRAWAQPGLPLAPRLFSFPFFSTTPSLFLSIFPGKLRGNRQIFGSEPSLRLVWAPNQPNFRPNRQNAGNFAENPCIPGNYPATAWVFCRFPQFCLRFCPLAFPRVSGNPEGNQRVPSTLRFRKFPGKPEGVWCSILFLSSFPRETREFP